MVNTTLTPEALERLEKLATAANRDRDRDGCSPREHFAFKDACDPATILALLRSYRTLESENRIAMRALELACAFHRGERPRVVIGQPEIAAAWLAEARAQEGKR